MRDKPKPCPWCGREPELTSGLLDYEYWLYSCDRGNHVIDGPMRKTKQGALVAWNKRLYR